MFSVTMHPGITLTDIEIRVVCANPPTEQMRQIDGIVPRDGQQITIPVTFAIFPDTKSS